MSVSPPAVWIREHWEVLALLVGCALIYAPWSATALPILDFSEFLPQLAAHDSPLAQLGAVASYLATQGRFCLLQYVHVVVAWNAFGMWAPGWHWTYFALNAGVILLGRQLLIELGVSRTATIMAIAAWAIAPPVAAGWLRPTGEPIGLIFFLIALRLAHNYCHAGDWRRRALLIAACSVGMIAAKEMLIVLLPVVWVMTRLRHVAGGWEWAAWEKRDSFALATSSAAVIAAAAPVAYVALAAPPGNYASRYGNVGFELGAFIERLETVLVPSRSGLPSLSQVAADPGWQLWLNLPALAWLAALGMGIVVLFRRERESRSNAVWLVALAAAWCLPGILAYMPWPGEATFYMLPFAFGTTFLAAHAFGAAFRSQGTRLATALAATFVIFVGTVEARDFVRENELRVRTDVEVLEAVARQSRLAPLVAAVPEPAPPGRFGWAKKLAEYGRVAGMIEPAAAQDVSCEEGRALALMREAVVVSGAEGCGSLSDRSIVVSELVPRNRWPWLFEGRSTRRMAYIAGAAEAQLGAADPEDR